MPTAADFVAGLPKAELHVHLQGAASVPTVLELARRHPDEGVPTDEAALRTFYEFRDFAHFIEVYIAVNRLVRAPGDVTALGVGLARDLAGQQVRYAEITVTPYSHLLMEMADADVAAALTAARQEASTLGVEVAWVFDIPGEAGLPAGERTIEWVERHAPEGTVGFGLGGPEIGVPRAQFADMFARARALGLASLPHAGETTGPETVRDAVEVLGAQRIGHGIAAAEDPELMAELAARGIPLEVCPTSNLRTRAVTDLGEHPWPVLAEAGVVLTVNSDDPGMFNTTLNQEYALAHEHFGVTLDGLRDLARTAVRCSYAPESTKRALDAEISAYVG